MRIGPITIQWTKDVSLAERSRTKLFMRRNRVIDSLTKDNDGMRQVLERILGYEGLKLDNVVGPLPKSKTPKGAGASL